MTVQETQKKLRALSLPERMIKTTIVRCLLNDFKSGKIDRDAVIVGLIEGGYFEENSVVKMKRANNKILDKVIAVVG